MRMNRNVIVLVTLLQERAWASASPWRRSRRWVAPKIRQLYEICHLLSCFMLTCTHWSLLPSRDRPRRRPPRPVTSRSPGGLDDHGDPPPPLHGQYGDLPGQLPRLRLVSAEFQERWTGVGPGEPRTTLVASTGWAVSKSSTLTRKLLGPTRALPRTRTRSHHSTPNRRHCCIGPEFVVDRQHSGAVTRSAGS